MLPYLIANHRLFGAMTPISGVLKSSFPGVFLRGIDGHGLATTVLGYQVAFGIVLAEAWDGVTSRGPGAPPGPSGRAPPPRMASATDNHVIAADMLTGNMRLYRAMRASPDALQFLLDTAARAGKPVRWIYFIGTRWLVPSPDRRAVVYHDPAAYPVLVTIGTLDLGHGPATIGQDQAGVDFIAWELAPGAVRRRPRDSR